MKKVLSSLLALALALGLCLPAAAAPPSLLHPVGMSSQGDAYFVSLYLHNPAEGFKWEPINKNGGDDIIWKYDDDALDIYLITLFKDEKPRARVREGDVSESVRLIGKSMTPAQVMNVLGIKNDDLAFPYGGIFNLYKLVVKSQASPTGIPQGDERGAEYKIDIDYARSAYNASELRYDMNPIGPDSPNLAPAGLPARTIVHPLTGLSAYSDTREVESGGFYSITESKRDSLPGTTGSIFDFSGPITEQARIRVSDYVDLFFKGNYGTDKENLRVWDDPIAAVEKYLNDSDIDYYDFAGKPKFATDVTCLIDGDKNAYIYEYDKDTGDMTNITSECTYTSDGWRFSRKVFKTYLLTETFYEDCNIKE